MKQLIFAALSTLVALVGCNHKKELPFDPYTQIALNAATPQSKITASKPPYTIDTILRYATYWSCRTKVIPIGLNERGLAKEHRDFVNKRLFIGGNYEVVATDNQGNPKLGWFMADSIYDMVLGVKFLQTNINEWYDIMADNSGVHTDQHKRDTIGYIPNRVVREAERQIKVAFEAGNYDECLRLFHDAYVFIPITGAEWRALKAKNEQ